MTEQRMIVLVNSTPLISLARRGLFDLLRGLYGRIILPPAVYREVVTEGEKRAGARETAEAIAAGWMEVIALQDPEAAQRIGAMFLLGDGESIRSGSGLSSLQVLQSLPQFLPSNQV